ncbi:MAG: hypothetical protein HFJ59_04685 [Clostridia bacterium]|nr:hypothetical protein [Clostridia bacterium]
MLLRYLETVTLKKSITVKQPNGSRIEEYETLGEYEVPKQELDDQISASIYGASIVNMLRIKTPLSNLENLLKSKLNNTTDNISKYFIFINKTKYKIKSVNSKGIEIELV